MILSLHPTILTFLGNILLNSRLAPLLNSVWMPKYSSWKVKSCAPISLLFRFVRSYKCLECNQFKLSVWLKYLNHSFQLIKSDKSNLVPRNNFREIWNQFSDFLNLMFCHRFLSFYDQVGFNLSENLAYQGDYCSTLLSCKKDRRILKCIHVTSGSQILCLLLWYPLE